jgi:hypothetical protein
MKIKFIFICAVILLIGCKHTTTWTTNYKITVRDSLLSAFKIQNRKDKKFTKSWDCIIIKLEKSYPNKIPKSGVPLDTLIKMSADCCSDCLKL